MIGLKSKTLSLPHLSLSRTSSPSRKDGSQPTTPVLTPLNTSTPGSSAPSSASSINYTPPTSTAASPNLKPKRSNSPKSRAVDAEAKEGKLPRRSSIGASIAAFTSRSSSPPTAPTGDSSVPPSISVPSGLTLTPATTTSALSSGRSSSGDKSGLRPLRSLSGIGKVRSKSSDRAHEVAGAPAVVGGGAVPAAAKEKRTGVMGIARRGLALSQQGAARSSSVPAGGSTGSALNSPAATPGTTSPVFGSGAATPAQAYAMANGGSAPPVQQQVLTPVATSGGGGVQLHQLAESYVGKVSLRLGEAVNKVFLPIPTGPGGIPIKEQERLEAPYGGTAAGWKGRSAPRVARSREVGELISTELQAALHDPYLLRTLLRSSVLKALSLFLTRLSALLLLPSPSDPALSPALFSAPTSVKEADNLPLPLRYNLQVVRCAYEVKRSLQVVADPAAGFPAFVEETLRPWRAKLAELIGRVMTPLVGSARLLVGEICGRARLEGVVGGNGVEALHGASLAVNVLSVPVAGVRQSATSQLRSLSLGRASPAPGSGALTPTTGSFGAPTAAAAAAAATAGPSWLRDLSSVLDAFARLVAHLECGRDADKWLVSVGTAVIWKGMLNCSARTIGIVGVSSSPTTANGAAEGPLSPPLASATKKGFLGGVTVKKTPSPPASPPLPTVELASAATAAASATARLASAPSAVVTFPSPSDVAFVRLLSDLELLEARLRSFLSSSLSNASFVLSPAAPPAQSCPGGPSCGLCRTGRTFDDESSDSEDDEDEPHNNLRHDNGKRRDPGRESRLAHAAMREAMQALSGLVVVVRASRDPEVIRRALEDAPMEHKEDEKDGKEKMEQENGEEKPMTPSALFATLSAPPSAPAAATTAASSSTSLTLLPPISCLSPHCPTLHSALLELPPLLLLHLLASRFPPSSGFRLPHDLWTLRGGWDEYASELRGFGAGEEWAAEVAWEVGGEVERVCQGKEMGGEAWRKGEREVVEALRAAVRRAGGGAGERR
ncbi:hypothetical protein JCM8547_003016 [Rhodosporidiobolus lusitaniae]